MYLSFSVSVIISGSIRVGEMAIFHSSLWSSSVALYVCTTTSYPLIYLWTFRLFPCLDWGFPGGSDGKESACDAGNVGSIPGSGRSPGEGNGNPLQYSCLENSVDRGAWQPTVHGITESDMTEQLALSYFMSWLW